MDEFERLLEAERVSVERFVRFRMSSKADADDVRWLRSPNYNNNNNFCNVNTGGGNNNNNAYYSAALLPGFYRYTVKWSNRKVKDDRCKRRDTSQGETPETAL